MVQRVKVDFVVELRERAQFLLQTHFSPAGRYGTAFHLTSPFSDLRTLALDSFGVRELASPDFSLLSDFERGQILELLDGSDPYLLWYLAHADKLPVQVLVVPAGQTMDLELNGSLVTFVFLQAEAKLNLIHNVLNESLGISRLFVWQSEASSLSSWGLRAGNSFLSERVEVYLQGLGASALVRHLTVGTEKQQADMAVRVYHQAPQTTSDLVVRTAAAGKHVAVYRGLIDIDERGKGSKGYQSGRALLLNRGAVVDMLPELAIKTNDVQCSHGVTTTHIDEAALFYMRSRGLPVAQARRLAMTGFFHDMLEIPQSLAAQLEQRL